MLKQWGGLAACFFMLNGMGGAALTDGPEPTEEVARVDTFKITVADLKIKLQAISPANPDKNFEQRRKMALDELLIDRLVGLKAKSVPVEQDSQFIRTADHLLKQVQNRVFMNQVVLSLVSVGDSEVLARYREKPEEYELPELVRASHILIAPVKDTAKLFTRQRETGWWADSDQKAKAIADSIFRLAAAGCAFDSLAREWSQDRASALGGGDLNRFRRNRMVPEFDSVAFRLRVGEISPPVKTKFGYHIIKITDRQERQTAPLTDSLKEFIATRIRNEKAVVRANFYLDSLRMAAGVRYNDRLLEMADSLLGLPDSLRKSSRKWAVLSAYGDTVWSDRWAGQLAAFLALNPDQTLSRDQKLDALKNLINPYLVLRAMKETKVEESGEFLREKERIYLNEKLVRVRQGANAPSYQPSEEEIRAFFESHRPEFPRRDTLSVRVQQIVFQTKREAEAARRESVGGTDFFAVARRYYPGDTALMRESFDLGFISPPAMPGEFFAVAETLTAGSVSRPVKTEWGYHLIKVLERRPDMTFEFARSEIVNRLQQARREEHRQKWEAELRAGHRIKINNRLLKKIKDPSLEKLSSAGGS